MLRSCTNSEDGLEDARLSRFLCDENAVLKNIVFQFYLKVRLLNLFFLGNPLCWDHF